MNTAKALRRALAARGMTQADIARAAGWAPSYVSQLASGHREAGPETLAKLAEALRLPRLLLALLGAEEVDCAPGVSLAVAETLGEEMLAMVVERERATRPSRCSEGT